MRSLTEFLIIAVVVTLTPGPGTATILRVAARDGRRAALSAIVGTSSGVLIWGILSAAGVSSLILASQLAFDMLRVVGATVLIVIGLRSLLQRHHSEESPHEDKPRRRAGWRSGLVTSVSNPKLAVFFVAVFPSSSPAAAPYCPTR